MSNDRSDDEPRARSSRAAWGCFGFFIAAFVLMLVGIAVWYVAETARARSQLAAEVKKLRDRGRPVTTIDLNQQYHSAFQDPPYAAALIRALAAGANPNMQQLGKPLPFVGDGAAPLALDQPWTQQAEAEHFLAQNKELLDLLAQHGRNPTRIHFTSDLRLGFQSLMPNVQNARYGARVLSLRLHVELRHGRTDKAVECIEQQIALAEAMRDEPFIVGQLVRCAFLGVAIRDLKYLAENVDLTDAELTRLQAALRQPDMTLALQHGLAGEAASAYTASTWPANALGNGPSPLTPDDVARLANRAPSRPGDVALMLGYFRRIQTANDESLAAAGAEGKLIDSEIKALAGSPTRVFYIYTLLMFPAVGSATNAFQRAEANFQSADAVLAALRYRHAHQKWPDSLQQLVPAFLPAVPVDPYNGKELLFQATPTEFKVYAVGQNLVDDGGTWTDKDFADVGFAAPWHDDAAAK